MRRLTVSIMLIAVAASAQSGATQDEQRDRFGLAATRAVAWFRSADSIEVRLRARGATLHPALVALRARIEKLLDQIEESLDAGDPSSGARQLPRVEGLIDQYARALGGS